MNIERSELADSIARSAATLLGRRDAARFVPQERPYALLQSGIWQEISAAGWFQLMLSEEAGGLGLGVSDVAAVFREVGHAPAPGPLREHMAAVPFLVGSVGRHHPKHGILTAALSGGELLCMPEMASAPFCVEGGAPRLEGGRLLGSALVPFAASATGFVVSLRDGTAGSAVVLAPATAGQIRLLRNLDPNADLALVTFDWAVEAEALLLSGEAAAGVIRDITALSRITIAAEMAGAVEAMTSLAVEHAKLRKQFGKTIGSFQAVQHMLANLATKSDFLNNLVSTTAAQWRPRDPQSHRMAAIAKACAGKTGRFVAEEVLQILGATGFTEEHRLHIYYRRILSLEGAGGEADDLLQALGEALVLGGEFE